MDSPITPYHARVVSFSPNVKVKKTIHLKNYTNAEIAKCWYSPKETKHIRSEAMEEVVIISQDDNNNVCTTRGLENLTLDGRRSKMCKRYQAWDAVLDEQELQFSEGQKDDVTIARIYARISFECTLAAISRGFSDQQEVAESAEEAVLSSNFVVSVSPSTKKVAKPSTKKMKKKHPDIPNQICYNGNKKQSSSSSSSQSKLQPPRQQLQQHCFDICSKVNTTTKNTTKKTNNSSSFVVPSTTTTTTMEQLEDMLLHSDGEFNSRPSSSSSSSAGSSFWGPIDELDRVLSILEEVDTALEGKRQTSITNTNTTNVTI